MGACEERQIITYLRRLEGVCDISFITIAYTSQHNHRILLRDKKDSKIMKSTGQC